MILKNTSFFSLAVAATSFVTLLTPAQAFTPLSLTQTFNNPDPQVDDWFGWRVSLSGARALVAAPDDDTGAVNAGSVYLFDTVTGDLLQTFNNPTPQNNDQFGWSVSLSGTNALIGSRGDNSGAESVGSAYLFDTVTGDLFQTFNNPTPESEDQFGTSVSIDGTNALIGGIFDDTGAIDAGSAYLFDTVTGDLLQTFNNPTPEVGDFFGWSVSISGTNALIGAGRDDTGAVNAGSAYLFDIVTGDLLQTFNNPTPEFDDQFGNSVSISGTNALIGTHFDDTGAVNAGSAYLFNTVTGDLLQTFNNPTPQEDEFFGTSVSISGTNALIGANNDNTGVVNAGSAYLFNTVTGELLQTFNNPTPQEDEFFGNSVSISDTNALIGAVNDNTRAQNTGSAYLYQQQQVPEPSTLLGASIAVIFSIAFNRGR